MDAEKLLLDKAKGSFLVRVSEKVWGYTISYRAGDRCKHFLIDATEDQYHFFGPNQLPHASIIDLVNFHKVRIGWKLVDLYRRCVKWACLVFVMPYTEDLFIYQYFNTKKTWL